MPDFIFLALMAIPAATVLVIKGAASQNQLLLKRVRTLDAEAALKRRIRRIVR